MPSSLQLAPLCEITKHHNIISIRIDLDTTVLEERFATPGSLNDTLSINNKNNKASDKSNKFVPTGVLTISSLTKNYLMKDIKRLNMIAHMRG